MKNKKEEIERLESKLSSYEKLVASLKEKLKASETSEKKLMSTVSNIERLIAEEKEARRKENERSVQIEETLKKTEEKLDAYISGYAKAIEIIQTVDSAVPIVKHNAYMELASELKNHYKKNANIHKAIDKAIGRIDKLEKDK